VELAVVWLQVHIVVRFTLTEIISVTPPRVTPILNVPVVGGTFVVGRVPVMVMIFPLTVAVTPFGNAVVSSVIAPIAEPPTVITRERFVSLTAVAVEDKTIGGGCGTLTGFQTHV
jgi:hypothetical protein